MPPVFITTLPEIATALAVSRQAVNKKACKNNWQPTGERVQGGGDKYDIDAVPGLSDADKLKIKAHLLMTGAVLADDVCRETTAPAVTFPEQITATPATVDSPTGEEERAAAWDYYAGKSDKAKAEALCRFQAVKSALTMMNAGSGKMAACKAVAGEIGEHWQTVNTWATKVRDTAEGDWIPLLVDSRGGKKPPSEISPEAWDYILADYLRRERPTFQSCYERLQRAARQHGWAVPSLKTLKRKLDREIPHGLIVLKREGEDAYKKTFPAQERNHGVFQALEAVNGDGYTFFKYVRFESGEVCRPTVWFWQDVYSSMLASWQVDVSENKDMIRLSIGTMIERFSIPDHFWLDNTRAAANKSVTGGVKNRYRFKISTEDPIGLIPLLGAKVHWTTPGHGQGKPVERAFGIGGIGERTDKHPSFAGRGTQANPIPIAEFEAVLASEVAAFNARLGRRTKIHNGGSFDQAFAESYARRAVKKATSEQRALWLLAPEPVMANRQDGSIKIMGNRYWSEALARHRGKKLVARFDPANLHADVLIYSLDGRRIGTAQCILPVGFNDRDAARETAKQRARIRKKLREIEKSQLRINAREAAKFLPEVAASAPPSTKVVKGMFGRGEKPAEQEDVASEYNFDEFVSTAWEEKKKTML